MSVLTVDVGPAAVRTAVLTGAGLVSGNGLADLSPAAPSPDGRVDLAPDELWRAVLAASRAALVGHADDDVTALRLRAPRATLLVWDQETLGSPGPGFATADRRTVELAARLAAEDRGERVRGLTGRPPDPAAAAVRLRWLAEHEPHTWALVEDGRYAVGDAGSYLVARMSRGTWHVTDAGSAAHTQLLDVGTGVWSDELCARVPVPRDALPEVVPSTGRVAATDPRSFLGLEVPVTGLSGT
jgi:glycerol kinase